MGSILNDENRKCSSGRTRSEGQLPETQRREGAGRIGRGGYRRHGPVWCLPAFPAPITSVGSASLSFPLASARRAVPAPRSAPRTCFGCILKRPSVEDQRERAGAAHKSWAEQQLHKEQKARLAGHGYPTRGRVRERLQRLELAELVNLSAPPTWPPRSLLPGPVGASVTLARPGFLRNHGKFLLGRSCGSVLRGLFWGSTELLLLFFLTHC